MKLRPLFLVLLSILSAGLLADSLKVTQHFGEFNGLSHHHSTSLAMDRHGMIWIGTWNGLQRYSGYGFTTFKSHPGDGSSMEFDRIKNIHIIGEKIYCEVEHQCYVFDIRTGKFYYSGMTWEQSRKKYQIPAQPVRQLAGKDGITWTLDSSGFRKEYIRTNYYRRIPQMKPAQVRCLFRDHRERIWITTKEDSTVRVFDNSLHLIGYLTRQGTISKDYTSFAAPVYSMFQDNRNVFWLGSKPNHIYNMKETGNNKFAIHHILNDAKGHKVGNEIYDIQQDRWGRLWLSTMDKSLMCIPNPESEHFTIIDDMRQYTNLPKDCKSIRCVRILANDIMLVCSTRGLLITKLTGGDPRRLSFKIHRKETNREKSLSNSATMYAMEDERHHIYICTEGGGVNEIATGNLMADKLDFRHYSENYISSGIEYKGVKWFIGTKEFEELVPGSKEPVYFNNDVWKDELLFSDATPLSVGDNHWILGLMDGAMVFDFNQLHKANFVPQIVLTHVIVENGKQMKAVSELDTILMNEHERDIRIYFAALDYRNSENISYRFKLDDGNWNSLYKEHSIALLNLHPGKHTVTIESKMQNGAWAGNARNFTLIVKPTIWQTTFAKIIYFLLLVGLIALVVYIYNYIKDIKRKQEETLKAYLRLEKAGEITNKEVKGEVEKSFLSNDQKVFMDKIMECINNNLDNSDLSVNDLANYVGTSRSGINRKLKSIIGITPKELIIKSRMQKACTLLRTTDMTVKEIAYECGFTDQNYFGKSFKQIIGVSPSSYRQKDS